MPVGTTCRCHGRWRRLPGSRVFHGLQKFQLLPRRGVLAVVQYIPRQVVIVAFLKIAVARIVEDISALHGIGRLLLRMEGIRAGKFLLEFCYFVLALGEEARLLFFDLFQAGLGAVGHFLSGDHGILPLCGVWGFHCFLGKQEADGIRDWQCRFIESDFEREDDGSPPDERAKFRQVV